MKVGVGSTNPVKVEAVEEALGFPALPVPVQQPVSPTPLSAEEMMEGAEKRARAALVEGTVLGVGIEGGLCRVSERWFLTAYAAVWDGERLGVGQGFAIPFPTSLVERLSSLPHGELGLLMEELSGRKGVARAEGAVGLLTGNFLTRKHLLREAVKAAYGHYLSQRLSLSLLFREGGPQPWERGRGRQTPP